MFNTIVKNTATNDYFIFLSENKKNVGEKFTTKKPDGSENNYLVVAWFSFNKIVQSELSYFAKQLLSAGKVNEFLWQVCTDLIDKIDECDIEDTLSLTPPDPPLLTQRQYIQLEEIQHQRKQHFTSVNLQRIENPPPDGMGYIYILKNKSMVGLLKIGMTTQAIKDRISQLNSTGVPTNFELVYSYQVAINVMYKIEQQIHIELNNSGYHWGKEFFKCDEDVCINIIDELLGCNSI